MTWGIFALYACDHYPPEGFQRIKTVLEREMDGRGFIHFTHFNDQLLALHKRLGADGSVADLVSAT
jgi:hypothetical protein